MDSQDGEGTFEAVGCDAYCLGEVTGTELVVDACDSCGGYLGVSLRGELHAFGEQLSTQFCKVFDNTVVDDGEAAVVDNVGVSVDVGGSTVGCPTGVTDTNLGFRQGVFLNLVLEVQELTCLLTEFDTVGAHECHAGRVVAAVFLAAQTFEDHIVCVVVKLVTVRSSVQTYISYDSTHAISLSHKYPNMRTVKYRYASRSLWLFLPFSIFALSSHTFIS